MEETVDANLEPDSGMEPRSSSSLLAICAALALALGLAWLVWSLVTAKQRNHELSAALARVTNSLAAQEAALKQSRQTADALQNKVSQLVMVLTNSTAELKAARQRIEDLESRASRSGALLPDLAKDPEVRRQLPRYAPAILISTNAAGQEIRSSVFKILYGPEDRVLGRDLEYSALYGRRLAFKETASTRRVAFDVDELHPYVLAHLGINPEESKQYQARQEAVWRRVEAMGIKLEEEKQSQREARQAAAAAARIEAEKLMAQQREKEFQEEMQRRALENDALRAEATMRAADAAIIRALNPPPVIINTPVRVPVRW